MDVTLLYQISEISLLSVDYSANFFPVKTAVYIFYYSPLAVSILLGFPDDVFGDVSRVFLLFSIKVLYYNY